MTSHEHKFIYTKIGKTGSSTIFYTLANALGKEGRGQKGHYHILDAINSKTAKYFKFTFVRNPWARAVSFYHFVKEKRGPREEKYRQHTFSDLIRSDGPPYDEGQERKFFLEHSWAKHSPTLQKIYDEKHPFENQLDWISDDNGKVLPDFIGRLENLQEDFNTVCDKIGIPRQQLPHHNKSNHKHYTEYYNDELRDLVAEKYKRDIEYFGYEFGE